MRLLLLALVFVATLAVSAQDAPDFIALIEAGEAVQADARLGLVTALERNGVRAVVSSRDAPTLYASVREGAVADWIAVSHEGRFLPVSHVAVAAVSVATTHHACTLAPDGTAYCWQIDAPGDGGEAPDGR